MDDTQRIEALLTALIDALGFDVEESVIKEAQHQGMTRNGWQSMHKKIVEYKLTKRKIEQS